ncbi:hypothetical protein [Lacticaseibacillus paracasei]|uniref:hypothetical protein n=1 Tax=Lacticaseibacillus paracasei TaxID=1597 RepID=UPI000A8C8E9F|nr:hypothetical protein [Lacticaseibacillus paracasei]
MNTGIDNSQMAEKKAARPKAGADDWAYRDHQGFHAAHGREAIRIDQRAQRGRNSPV